MTATQAARRGSRAWLRCPWAAAGLAGLRHDAPSHRSATSAAGVEGAGGTCCGARGRWRAWPGFETTHRATDQRQAPPVWRAPEGPAAVPVGGGGPGRASRRRAEPKARGADGSRAGRRPPAHTAAGPSGTRPPVGTQNRPAPRVRAAQSVSEAHRRITTMSGSPRPLSWRTLEIPSLAAISFAVPSMRGSS